MLCWSVTFVWIKVALKTYHPYEITFLRLLMAVLLLFLVQWIGKKAEKVSKKDLQRLMLISFCEPFLYFIGEANGMQFVSPTLGSLVISTIPIFAALGAWFILRERVSPLLLLGLLISCTGVAVMSLAGGDFSANTKGILFLTIAVFAGTFYAILVRDLTHRYSALTIVSWQSLFGLLYFLPLFLLRDGNHFLHVKHSADGLIIIAAMSLFGSVGAFMLFTGVIRELGVVKSNVFTNLIPVFTVVLAFLILGDTLNTLATLGLALTLVGLVLSQYKDLRKLNRKKIISTFRR